MFLSSQGDRSDFESAMNVNCKPLGEDLSNHNIAAGMWVYHDHRLRPKANRKSFPSGSVIFPAVHSAVNVFQGFINGFKTHSWSAAVHPTQNIFKDTPARKPVVRRNQVNTILLDQACL